MQNTIKDDIDKQINKFYQRVRGEMFSSARGIEDIHSAVLDTSKEIGGILKIPLGYWGVEEKELKSREALLYTVPGYRDHFIHQFNVFLTGYKIIDLLGTESFSVPGLEKPDQYCNIYRIWFLCSLFHDIVYTIEKMNKWLPSSLQRFLGIVIEGEDEKEKEKEWNSIYNHNILNWDKFYMLNKRHFTEMKRHYVSSLEGVVGTDSIVNLNGLFEEGILGEKKNHGTMSAIWLLRQEKPEDIYDNLVVRNERKARVIAATAIALHTRDTLDFIKSDIFFDKFSIPFLLMFCDNLCEWGRLRPIEGEVNANKSGKHEAIRYESKGPKLKNLEYDDEEKVLTCQLVYLFEGLDEEDRTSAKENIYNDIKSFVGRFTFHFFGGDYKFVIEYFLDEELIEQATIVFNKKPSK